jgi:hypothetical protein
VRGNRSLPDRLAVRNRRAVRERTRRAVSLVWSFSTAEGDGEEDGTKGDSERNKNRKSMGGWGKRGTANRHGRY